MLIRNTWKLRTLVLVVERTSNPPPPAHPAAGTISVAATLSCIVPACLSACLSQEPSSSSSSWRPLAARARRLLLQGFLAAYPYLAGGMEASKFACQLLYLLEVAPVHHPLLALLGQRIVRVSGAEMVRGRRVVGEGCLSGMGVSGAKMVGG